MHAEQGTKLANKPPVIRVKLVMTESSAERRDLLEINRLHICRAIEKPDVKFSTDRALDSSEDLHRKTVSFIACDCANVVPTPGEGNNFDKANRASPGGEIPSLDPSRHGSFSDLIRLKKLPAPSATCT